MQSIILHLLGGISKVCVVEVMNWFMPLKCVRIRAFQSTAASLKVLRTNSKYHNGGISAHLDGISAHQGAISPHPLDIDEWKPVEKIEIWHWSSTLNQYIHIFPFEAPKLWTNPLHPWIRK